MSDYKFNDIGNKITEEAVNVQEETSEEKIIEEKSGVTGFYVNLDGWSTAKQEDLRDVVENDASIHFLMATEMN